MRKSIFCLLLMGNLLMAQTSTKKVALIIASDGFQPIEYGSTKTELENAGFTVMTISDKPDSARDTDGETVPVDMSIQDVNPKDFAGIFIIGGAGALKHLDRSSVHTLMQKARDAQILWGAICISPRILAHAKLLSGTKITGWDGDQELQKICDKFDCTYIKKPVVVDGNLVTANGPTAAHEFGKKIAELLKTS